MAWRMATGVWIDMSSCRAAWPSEVLALRARGLTDLTIVKQIGVPLKTILWALDEQGEVEADQVKLMRRLMTKTLRDERGLRTP